jgi:hypothetical protein
MKKISMGENISIKGKIFGIYKKVIFFDIGQKN